MGRKSPDDAEILDKLIENAFCFLETAIDEFETKPKYSVVHFSTAIELFLKARLVYEHWSLIIDRDPDRQKFLIGNFKSINFRRLPSLIENVLDKKIPDKAKNSFIKLSEHRNQAVHFFHDEIDKEEEGEDFFKKIRPVAVEQYLCWHFLRNLLEEWHVVFNSYNQRIFSISIKMNYHKTYLDKIFKEIIPDIKADEEKGFEYTSCVHCNNRSAKIRELTDESFEFYCRLCQQKGYFLRVLCPDCEKERIDIYDSDNIEKCKCGHLIEKDDFSEIIDTEPVTTDNYFDHTPISCAMCGGHHSVVHHHDYVICTECIVVFSENEWGICGWCSEGQAGGGDMEYSYHSGCEFCDGNAGWTRND